MELKIGDKVYAKTRHGIVITSVVKDTGKFYKLNNGTLISKEEDGRTRGAGTFGHEWYKPLDEKVKAEIGTELAQQNARRILGDLNDDIKIWVNDKTRDDVMKLLKQLKEIREEAMKG